jgi:diguanylate cyclase (GGDEF)-like protein
MQKDLKKLIKMVAAVAVMLILSAAFVAYRRTAALVESDRLMPVTQQAVDAIDDVLSDLQEGEAGEQGYLLTLDEAHHSRFERARRSIGEDLARVRSLSATAAGQQYRAKALEQKTTACFERWSAEMVRHTSGRAADKVQPDAEVENVRELVNEMNDFEFREVQMKTEQAQRNAEMAMLALLGSTLCSVGAIAGAFVFLQRESAASQKKEKQTLDAWVKELQERTDQISFLNEVSSALQICITSEEAHAAVATFMQRLFPASCGMLALISNSRDALDTVCQWGAADFEKAFAPDECFALRTGRAYLRGAHAERMTCKHLPGSASGYICLPMMAQGESLGILHVQHEAFASLTDADAGRQKVLTNVTEHFAMALANLRLRETLKNQSIRDPLTSLFNRRYMETTLEREARRTARNKSKMAVMMADLDHFKHFNDTFGHDAGDVLLREAAACLRKAVRAEDIVCRYGGEEFTIVLLDTDQTQAVERAARIVESIRAMNVQFRGQPLGRVTMSIGVAIFPEHSENTNELLSLADKALYQAKSDGRDRVVVYAVPRMAIATSTTPARSQAVS